MLRLFAGLTLLVSSAFCQAQALLLESLMVELDQGPQVASDLAHKNLLNAQHQQRQLESGWQWFSSISLGQQNELIKEATNYGHDRYQTMGMALGVRHPLLGTWYRHQQMLASTELDIQRQRFYADLHLAEQRLILRTAYADWWRASEEVRVCAALNKEAGKARGEIERRQREGWLLKTEAKAHLDQWRVLERRCQRSHVMLGQMREAVSMLIGRPLAETDVPVPELIHTDAMAQGAWLQALRNHPQMKVLQAEFIHAEQHRQSPWYQSIDANVALSQTLETRTAASNHGGGLVASFNLSSPFDVLTHGRLQTEQGQARFEKAQADAELTLQQLQRGLGNLLAAYRLAVDEWFTGKDELESAIAYSQQVALRQQAELESRWLGRWEAALALQKAQLDLIGVWHNAWRSEAALKVYSESDPAFASLLGTKTARWSAQLAAEWQQGVYVWHSAPLLDPKTIDAELKRLQQAHITRLYVGLSAEQLKSLTALKMALNRLLAKAEPMGFEVVLLLGEPSWIEPTGRGALLNLLQTLKDVHFHALHLDLEVEQLGWPVPSARLESWLDTLAAVSRQSPWPVEISSHHRWFAPSEHKPCVACRLNELGLNQISVMIYSRNTEHSAELIKGIAKRWPGLTFRLAQSIEPELDRSESLYGSGAVELQEQAQIWRNRLSPLGVTGIDWQEWNHYPR